MTRLTLEQQRALVRQRERAEALIAGMRRGRLRGMPHDWRVVEGLPVPGESCDGPPRLTGGLVEQQRIFMRGHGQGIVIDERRKTGGSSAPD